MKPKLQKEYEVETCETPPHDPVITMTPHQREKEILGEVAEYCPQHPDDTSEPCRRIQVEKLASYLYKLESRLDELERKVEEDSKRK